MDDISSGCENEKVATQLCKDISMILAEADFPLRKWASNSEQLLASIPDELKEPPKTSEIFKYVNTLGLKWYFEADKIGFKHNMELKNKITTKTSVLSQIATIYDPLGLLSPITIYNKILMQEIWKEKIGWDDKISENIEKKWHKFLEEAPIIEKIKVKRWTHYKPTNKIELHGFSDASEAAMGACIYLKTYDNDMIEVNLIAAKTKVSPTKKITLPRLELCAAVLLVKLMRAVKIALNLDNVQTSYYSDSEITLAWINGNPSRWKTFVANRVSKIQEISDSKCWNYVNTKCNPADLASRGVLPSELQENKLWWHGPSMLLNEENITLERLNFKTQIDEKKAKTAALHLKLDTNVLNRFSNLNRAIRSVAYCKKIHKTIKK